MRSEFRKVVKKIVTLVLVLGLVVTSINFNEIIASAEPEAVEAAEAVEIAELEEISEVAEPAEPPVHVHTEGEWTWVTPITMTEDGIKEKRCTECGEVLNSMLFPSTFRVTVEIFQGTRNLTMEEAGVTRFYIYKNGDSSRVLDYKSCTETTVANGVAYVLELYAADFPDSDVIVTPIENGLSMIDNRWATIQVSEISTDIQSITYGDFTNPNALGEVRNVVFNFVRPVDPESYTIEYQLDGGSFTGESSPVTYNSESAFSFATPVKDGFKFLGWAEVTDGVAADTYTAGIVAGTTGNKIYKAVWEANTYTVTYNYKGTGSNKAIIVDKQNSSNVAFGANVLQGAPSKLGFETLTINYVFAGWYYDAEYQLPVSETATLATAGNINLYAKYTLQTIAYFYILNPGLGMPSEAGQYDSTRYSNGIKVYGVLPLSYNGKFIYNSVNIKDGVPADTFIEGAALPTTATYTFKTNKGLGTVLSGEYSVTWYVVKTAGSTWHVDGFINNQVYPLTINYVYGDGDLKGQTAAPSYTANVNFGSDFSVTSPVISNYTASLNSVDGIMSGSVSQAVTGYSTTVYYYEKIETVNVEYYKDSLTGTLIKSETLNISANDLSTSDNGLANILKSVGLNAWRPTSYNDGYVAKYDVEAKKLAIVYTPIKQSPQVLTVKFVDQFGNNLDTQYILSGWGATAPTVQIVPGYTFTGWDKAFNYISEDITVTALYSQDPVVIEETPVPLATPVTVAATTVEIQDEEVPLEDEVIAEEPEVEETVDEPVVEPVEEDEVVTEIQEEEVPLATLSGDCWIHWLILLLSAAYGAYGVIRAIARNKQIHQLQGNSDEVNA